MALERFEQAGPRVAAHFADGGSAEADLRIGADGIPCGCAPSYAGYSAWRAVVAFPRTRLIPANTPAGQRSPGGERVELLRRLSWCCNQSKIGCGRAASCNSAMLRNAYGP